jgi:hypothetical protein
MSSRKRGDRRHWNCVGRWVSIPAGAEPVPYVSLTARLSIRRDRNQFWQKLRGLHAAALAELRSWNIAE